VAPDVAAVQAQQERESLTTVSRVEPWQLRPCQTSSRQLEMLLALCCAWTAATFGRHPSKPPVAPPTTRRRLRSSGACWSVAAAAAFGGACDLAAIPGIFRRQSRDFLATHRRPLRPAPGSISAEFVRLSKVRGPAARRGIGVSLEVPLHVRWRI